MTKKQQKEVLVELADNDKLMRDEILVNYQRDHMALRRYPHYYAWLDSEEAIYEVLFGEGQAFRHGFLECYNMFTQHKSIHESEVRDALITIATSSSGAQIKKAIQSIKTYYYNGMIIK